LLEGDCLFRFVRRFYLLQQLVVLRVTKLVIWVYTVQILVLVGCADLFDFDLELQDLVGCQVFAVDLGLVVIYEVEDASPVVSVHIRGLFVETKQLFAKELLHFKFKFKFINL